MRSPGTVLSKASLSLSRGRALQAAGVDFDGLGLLSGRRGHSPCLLVVGSSLERDRLAFYALGGGRFPAGIAAAQVGDLESVLHQDALRHVPAQADLAVGHDDLAVPGQFASARAVPGEGWSRLRG